MPSRSRKTTSRTKTILIINPNTTSSMTRLVVESAERFISPQTTLVGVEPTWGFQAIEGFYEGFVSAAAVMERLSTVDEHIDAVVLAGFGEPGLEGARQLLEIPVVDIAEGAAHVASLIGFRFGIVTSLDCSVPQIEMALSHFGLAGRCAAIRATGIGVLELTEDKQRSLRRVAEVASSMIAQNGVEVICLGCAAMSGLDKELEQELGVPVVDGAVAAVKLAEALIEYGVSTSKIRSYASPQPKTMNGDPVRRMALR